MLKTRAQIEVTAQNKTGQLMVDTDTPIPVVKDIIAKILVFVQQIEDNMQEQEKKAQEEQAAKAAAEAPAATPDDGQPAQCD